MKIRLYAFAKKNNSTKQPTGIIYNELDANIKAPSSIINPVLELKTSPLTYNYVYIPSFARYYFIDDITFNTGLWIVSCSIDVLASWKTEIGSTSMYVTRSSAASTGALVDNLYPLKTDPTVDTDYINMGWTYTGFDNGYYVLGVQGQTATSTNAVIYFQLTPSQLSVILHAFYANSGSTWWGNTAKGVINSLNKIDDFIVSCRWYPFTFPVVSGGDQRVYIGSYDTNVDAPVLKDYPNTSFNKTFTLTSHSQASARGVYMNYAPFSRYMFYHDLIGTIELPPEICVGETVHITITPDYTTGQASFKLYVNPGQGAAPFYSTYVQIGVDIDLNGANVNVSGLIGSATSAVGHAILGDWLGAASSVGTAATEATADPGRHGPAGGYISIAYNTAIIRSIHYEAADQDNANQGRPYCKINTPGTLTGYVRAENPHVVTQGTDTETNMINNMIEAGIYYE